MTNRERNIICSAVYSSYCQDLRAVKRWRKICILEDKPGLTDSFYRMNARNYISKGREKLNIWEKLIVSDF